MTKTKCNHCKSNCSNCAERQAKAFELEVDEEMQQERLAQFWKKYSWTVYGAIFLILAITLSIEIYASWRIKTRLEESNLFESAVIFAHENKKEEAIKNFEELAQNAKTGYRTLAQLELSDLLLNQNEKEKALQILENAIQQTKTTDPLHQVAVLTFVGYQLDSDKTNELLGLLDPVLEDNHFQGLATELAVILLQKQNKKEEAKALLLKALLNTNVSDNTKARLSSLNTSLE